MKGAKELRPSQRLKSLYCAYLILVVIFGFMWWLAILAAFAPLIVAAIVIVPIMAIFIVTALWIPIYWHTITYSLTGTEITWRRGVWFRKTGIVPYNRITNIDIEQGPLSRRLGIASLKVQTAGYSATSGRTSELKLEGITDPEGLREAIMAIVRGKAPVAVETYGNGKEGSDVLRELVRIRKLLEKRK